MRKFLILTVSICEEAEMNEQKKEEKDPIECLEEAAECCIEAANRYREAARIYEKLAKKHRVEQRIGFKPSGKRKRRPKSE